MTGTIVLLKDGKEHLITYSSKEDRTLTISKFGEYEHYTIRPNEDWVRPEAKYSNKGYLKLMEE